MTGQGTERTKLDVVGLAFVTVTSVGWGLNWPIMKHILTQWPPLSARGLTGLVGCLALALYAIWRGQSLRVPSHVWPRLLMLSFLNVTVWMAVMGLALIWLPASECAVIAYTMPVWTALMAWPVLGERPNLIRVIALVMAFAGMIALFGGSSLNSSIGKLPGIALALSGAIGFALGTVLMKKYPMALPSATSVAWQIGIGCLPIAIVGLLVERPDLNALNASGWWSLAYMAFIQFGVAYVAWFAALERLPASVAAIGTMLVPVIGVVVSAITLGEPLGVAQIAALSFTLAGVALAARS